MPPRDIETWMWAEACDALARAERLHRQFFRLGMPDKRPLWEPPVDILETEDELWIIAALPGVEAPQVEISPERGTVLFPGTVLPITVGRPRSIAAAQEAVRRELPVGLVLQRDPQIEDPGAADLHLVGATALVLRYLTAPDGSHHMVCQGQHRFRVIAFLPGYPFLVARIERVGETEVRTPELEARLLHLKNLAREALELLPQAPPELGAAIQGVDAGGQLADLIASVMDLESAEKQEVLETFDVLERMKRVAELLSHRIEVLRLTNQISQQTKNSMEGRQREFLLREQLKTIQKELGDSDPKNEEAAELRRRIEGAKMPPEAGARSCASSARPASARRRSARASPAPRGANSCA